MTAAHDDGLAAAVKTYLPEISEDELRERVTRQLRRSYSALTVRSDVRVSAQAVEPTQDRDERLQRWANSLVASWVTPLLDDLDSSAVADPGKMRGDAIRTAVQSAHIVLVRAAMASLHDRRSAGHLAGTTPEERFDAFRVWLDTLRRQEHLSSDYGPSLQWARHLAISHVEHLLEVVQRWESDRETAAVFLPGIDAGDQIMRLEPGLGDPHNGGRSVTIVHLSSGNRVVYKPRSLRVDQAYQSIAEKLNTKAGLDLRAPQTLDRGRWGWAEFIEPKPGSASPSLHRRRLGHLTGLLHVLGASDIHYENVITDTAGRPVLIDAETLLSPRPQASAGYDHGAASRHGRELIEKSVLGIGTLPMVVSVPGRAESLDIGVAGGLREGQPQPFGSLEVRNSGRDDMHVELVHMQTPAGNNNPGVAGLGLEDVHRYRDEVREGVNEVLTWVSHHRRTMSRLLTRTLGNTTLRYVHCPTMFYVQLLRMQAHPAVLANPDARLAVAGRVHLRDSDATASLCAAEVAQLLGGDVPVFTFNPDSRDLHDAQGHLVVANFFARPPLQDTLDRVNEMTSDAIAVQLDLVDLAFVPVMPQGGEQTATSRDIPTTKETLPSLSNITRDVRSELASRFVSSTDPCHPATWYGPTVTTHDASQWTPGVLGYDIYGGSVGMAFALAATQKVSVNSDHDAAAVAKVTGPITEQVLSGALSEHEVSIGGMTGMGGTVWALDTCARLSGSTPPPAASLISALARHAAPDSPAEFTTGAAGALAASVALFNRDSTLTVDRIEPDLRRMLSPLLRGADGILSTANSAVGQESAYTGYAHGAAGMVAPLLETAALLGDESARQTGLDLVEKLLGCRERYQRWPRQFDGNSESFAWCHGAPGLLLGLSSAQPHCDGITDEVLEELVDTSLAKGLGNNPSLCHGDLGTLDVVLEHARRHGDISLADQTSSALLDVAKSQAVTSRHEARNRYRHVHSLVVGRAGVLYALSRATSADVPCVLGLR